MPFNEKLIELRKKAGLSQEDLTHKLGVSRQSISKWELGVCEPNIAKLQNIAILFNVSIDYLINDNTPADETTSNNNFNSNIEPSVNKLSFNYWSVFIVLGFIGIVICTIIPYVFEHLYCYTGHSGFLGYLEDWCGVAIVWKIGFAISIALFILGIVKTFKKKHNNSNREKQTNK